MPIFVLAMSVALLQQPGGPAQERAAAYDTSRAVVTRVAKQVALVRSGLDLFRRSVFNETDDAVLAAASHFRDVCHAMDSVAAGGSGRVCRHCADARIQAALDSYRQVLPTVQRTGARCAAAIAERARAPDGAKRLRRDVRVIGNPLVTGLRAYESRLDNLLQAMGGTPIRAGPAGAPGR